MKLLIAVCLVASAVAQAPDGTGGIPTNPCAAMSCRLGTECRVVNERGLCIPKDGLPDYCRLGRDVGARCRTGNSYNPYKSYRNNLFLSTIMYYYNHINDQCRPMWYRGCDGNENKFTSKAKCWAACQVSIPDWVTPPTRRPLTTSTRWYPSWLRTTTRRYPPWETHTWSTRRPPTTRWYPPWLRTTTRRYPSWVTHKPPTTRWYPPWSRTTTRRYPDWETQRPPTTRWYPPWMTTRISRVPHWQPTTVPPPHSCDNRNNEVWSQCNGHCGPVCGDPEPKSCPAVCMQGCVCRNGYAKDKNNRCVLKDRCPPTTRPTRGPPVQHCPDGSLPERRSSGGYKFCGRGPSREACGRGYHCEIHPADRYAICCRSRVSPGPPTPSPVQRCPDGSRPEISRVTGRDKFCGLSPMAERCSSGYYCHVHPTDRFAMCCRRDPPTTYVPTTVPPCYPIPCPNCLAGYSVEYERDGHGCMTRCYCREHTMEEACRVANCPPGCAVMTPSCTPGSQCQGPVGSCDGSTCPDGSRPESSSDGSAKFCGRGTNREDCGRGYSCLTNPLDLWAICCPRVCPAIACPMCNTGYKVVRKHDGAGCLKSCTCREMTMEEACKIANCPRGQDCVVSIPGCTKEGACPGPVGHCFPCRMYKCRACPQGQKINFLPNGCQDGCNCVPDCKLVDCAPDRPVCVVRKWDCKPEWDICPKPVAVCIESLSTDRCPPKDCPMDCANDFILERGCPICRCKQVPEDPCTEKNCNAGEVCNVVHPSCQGIGCVKYAICVKKTICTRDPLPCLARMTCMGGFQLDADGCEMCKCRTCVPECRPNERCVFEKVTCVRAPCLPHPVCKPRCPLVRCVECIKGLTYKKDENGCQTCECVEMTCKDLQCPRGQTCRLRDTGIRCVRAPCPSFVPECVPRIACPTIACPRCRPGQRLIEKKDQNGCLKECRCEGTPCPDIACSSCAPPLKTIITKDDRGCHVRCKCVKPMPCDTHKCDDDEICINNIPECFPPSGCPPFASCVERPSICMLPKDSGRQCIPPAGPHTTPRPGGQPHGVPTSVMLRNFYNRETGRCEGFGYLGCGGNANRFTTLSDCKMRCMGDGPVPIVTPSPPPTCRENMVLNNCVNLCQKKPTCEEPNPPAPQCKAMCRPMCVCKPGYVNNDAGRCIPLSQCRQTCKNKRCQPDEYCEMLYPPCPPPPDHIDQTNYCPPVPVCRKCVVPECLKFIKCAYGVAKNSHGCYTCNCNPQPTTTTTSIPIEQCTKLTCPRGYNCIHNGASESCVPDCRPVLCKMLCRYGWAQDERGCDVCQCRHTPTTTPQPVPVEQCTLPCPQGYKCVNTGARESCVPDCRPVRCRMRCHYGWAQDDRGCDICRCKEAPTTTALPMPTCAGITCPAGKRCELIQVQCIRAPCPPLPTCVQECKPVTCEIACRYGWVKNDDGCDICACNDRPTPPTCAATSCPVGYKCELKEVQCVTTPCYPQPTCVPDCQPVRCRMACRDGWVKDERGCDICKCYRPPVTTIPPTAPTCDDIPCADDEKCELQRVVCKKAPCYPQPTCVPADCQPVRCRMYCRFGWVKDERGCDICKCYWPVTTTPPPAPTCDDINCADDEKCELQKVTCVTTPCYPQPRCVPRCKAFEEYTSCGSACNPEPTCAVPKPTPTNCIAMCVERCLCQDGYIRDENNRCIRKDECPPAPGPSDQCPANQHLDSCTKPDGCYVEASCSDRNPKPPTDRVCAAVCVSRCVCDTGYIRKANSQCVRPDQCPTP